MSDTTNAVFLSYASQDAPALRRICESLRAAGVEVWFDADGGLEHGDEWDVKIRKQIRECLLFVPVISANTQARHEGYFRIEWELASQRAMGVASGVPFILPIVIDDTREPDALVPDRFRSVQWTRLPGGVVPPEVQARFLKLYQQRRGGLTQPGWGHASGQPGASASLAASPAETPAASAPRRPIAWIAAAGAMVVIVVAGWLWSRRAAPAPAVAAAPAAGKVSAPLSVARLRAQRAADLAEDLAFTRENYGLADDLCQQALALDKSDAEVWATAALISQDLIFDTYDSTPRRVELARSQAERAIRLDPNSLRAALAVARNFQTSEEPDDKEAERALRVLFHRVPTDRLVLRNLARTERALHNDAGVRDMLARLKALPGGDPRAVVTEVKDLRLEGRYVEAETLVDELLAGPPVRLAFYEKLLLLTSTGRSDLDTMRVFLAKIPVELRQEDAFGSLIAKLWLWSGDGAKALEALGRVPHDFLEEFAAYEPRSYPAGWGHRLAGRPTAAQREWESALALVDGRLATDKDNVRLLSLKATLQVLLGQPAAARETWKLRVEFGGPDSPRLIIGEVRLFTLLGEHEEAITRLLKRWAGQDFGSRCYMLNDFRFGPEFAPIRADPRVQRLFADQMAELAQRRPRPGAPAPLSSAGEAKSVAADKSVAVLAFADLSAARDSEYFSDGISEELLNVLAKVPGLKVTARTSAFFFKGKNLPIPEIAQKLGVAYVIEGSVQRAGERVKITAQLIKAADGFHVWSDTFTRDAKDVFAVEEEIAGLIAKNLSLKLGVSSAAATASVNPQAFELYVQARQAWNLRTAAGYDRAEALFAHAVELDPNFARAYVGQADVLDLRAWDDGSIGRWDQRHSEVFKKIRALLDRAIALDPELAEAYASLGTVVFDEWNYRDALVASRRAVQLNPNYATGWFWLGELLWDRGEMDEALAAVRQAVDLDPLSIASVVGYSLCLRDAGRPREALAQAERAMQVQPNSRRALAAKALALQDLGRTEAAVPLVRELLKTDDSREWWLTGIAVARSGLKTETEELLAQYRRAGNDRLAAPMLAVLDRHEEFFAVWQKRPMTTNQPWYIWSPQIDALRHDPRFLQVLEQVGLTEAHARAQAWRKAHPPEKPAAK